MKKIDIEIVRSIDKCFTGLLGMTYKSYKLQETNDGLIQWIEFVTPNTYWRNSEYIIEKLNLLTKGLFLEKLLIRETQFILTSNEEQLILILDPHKLNLGYYEWIKQN